MSSIDNQNGISLSSYTKDQWEVLLKETAYRGFKIHKISKRLKKAQEFKFEDDHLINLISKKGNTITVDMEKVLLKRDRWSFSRLIHNCRLLFPNSAYTVKFNDRMAKLAEKLAQEALPQDFHNRCQANLGNFAVFPTDIHDQIIYTLPLKTFSDVLKCIDLMKMFWKAPLGSEAIFGTIDVVKFADWIDKNRYNPLIFDLSNEDLKLLFPHLIYLKLNPKEFNFEYFDLIGHCKNLKFLEISDSTDFTDDHFQYIFNLPNLEHLSIFNCPEITDEGLTWIRSPNKLTNLDIEGCKITSQGFNSIKNLTNLTNLTIWSSKLDDDKSIKHLTALTRLEYLKLGYTKLTKKGFKHLQKIPSLHNLTLKGCFTDDDLEPIGKIKSLKDLSIYNAKITGDGFKYLAESTSLEVLCLKECKSITDDNLHYVDQIQKLFYFSVSHCDQLTRENFDKLRVGKSWRP